MLPTLVVVKDSSEARDVSEEMTRTVILVTESLASVGLLSLVQRHSKPMRGR